MRSFVASLSSTAIYEGCRTPLVQSHFSESSSDPSFSLCSSAREIYQGLRTPDWRTLSLRSGEIEAAVDENERELLDEVRMQRLLRHLNIVNFKGYYTEGNQIFVVHEHDKNLSGLEVHLDRTYQSTCLYALYRIIYKNFHLTKKHLDWNTRIKIAAGVAKGLEFLCDEAIFPVIFGGLKASNILIGKGYIPNCQVFSPIRVSSWKFLSQRSIPLPDMSRVSHVLPSRLAHVSSVTELRFAMTASFAPLSSSEIYQGCRTPSIRSVFSASSAEPTLSPSASAREHYEGLSTPRWWDPPLRSPQTGELEDGDYSSPAKRWGILVGAVTAGVASPNPKVEVSEYGSETFKFDELAAATKYFRFDCLLGEGGYGRVYRGIFRRNNQVVAIKHYNYGTESKRELLVEVRMQSLLHHQNIVNFKGYYTEGNQIFVVHEYMSLGSLQDHLHDLSSDKKHLDWNTRMKIAAGVAKGLEFLHEAIFPVIFGRLKASNILLGKGYIPKLSDLGLALLAPVGDESAMRTTVIGTDGYSAPEHVMSRRLSLKSNIYSFGVVLLEIITGRKAVENSKDAEEPSLVEWARPLLKDNRNFPQMADPMLGGQYPIEDLCEALDLASKCVQERPNVRPRIRDIARALTDLASHVSNATAFS